MALLGPLATVLLVLIIVTYVIMVVYIYAENYASKNVAVKGNALTDSSGVTPTAPVNLIAGNLTSSSATLTWQTVPTALQYTLLYQIANSKTWVSYYTGTSVNITVNNLTPYAVYNFGVCAINNYGQSTTTVLTGIQLPGPNTSGAAPSAPTNLTPGNTTTTSVVLSWTPGAGSNAAAQYNVLYQIVGSATSDWIDFATVSITTATVTGLKPNVPYNFAVTAINNYGTSVMTVLPNFEVSNTPSGTPPLAPTGLTVSSSDNDSVTLTWMTAPKAVQYQVLYQVSGSTPHGGWIEFNNTPSATITVTGLLSQIPYNFSVSSLNNYGSSSPSIISNVKLAPLSAAGSVSPPPINFQCLPGVGSATLTWVAPPWTDTQNPIQYQILYQVDGGTSWITLPLTSDSSLTIDPLLSYVMYNFEIVAIDNYGASPAVDINQVLIPGPEDTTVLPVAPSDFVLLDSNSESIDVQWSSVSNAAQYQIRYQVLGSTEWTEYAVTANTSLRISGLSPYVPYNFSVSGINNLGLGAATSLSNVQLSPTISSDKLPSYPTSIQAANLTPSSVTLNWSSVSMAAQYQIQYQVSSSSDWIESAVVNSTTLTISNLSPYIPYNFSVTAINNTGSSTPGYLTNVTLPGPPTAQTAPTIPTGIASSNITTNTVDLTWSASSGTAQYEVQYQVSGSPTWTFYHLTTSTVMTVTGLSSYVSYNFSITAINNYGSSPIGTLNNVVMLGPQNTGSPPPSVSNLQVGTVTSTSVPLTWSGVTGVTQYRVQYQVQGSPSSADGWVEFAVVSSPLTTVTGLLNYVTYNFSVVAINNYGASNATIVTGVQIPGPGSSGSAPMPPVNLQYGALTTTTVPLSWSPNTTGSGTPIQYEVSYQVVGSASNAWALFGVTTTPSLVVTGLVPSTQYNFSVIAINNYGASQGSLINSLQTKSLTPAGTAPLTPSNLVCTASTVNTLTLTWTPVNTATQYTVAYQVSGSASNSWVQLGNTSNSNVTVNSLASGSNYNFTVTAINNYGSSPPASLNLVQTLAMGANGSVPVLPTGLSVVSATPNSVNLIWNTSPDAVQYAVNYQTVGSGTSWVEFGTTTNESTTITGLIPYVRYNFSIIAINNYGVSNPLILNDVPIPSLGGSGSVPASPIGFKIVGTAVNSASMLFQWNSVTGATQYLFAYKLATGTQWYDIIVSTNSIVLDTLVPNLNYSFSVSSINTSGTSPANLLNNVTILPAVTGLSKTSNTLSWNTVPGANNYIVGYSGPATYSGVTDASLNWVMVPTSTTSISTTNLSGTPYSFYVFAQNTVTATAGFASTLMNAM
jgi:fibronectin type 3 domain-containing protein